MKILLCLLPSLVPAFLAPTPSRHRTLVASSDDEAAATFRDYLVKASLEKQAAVARAESAAATTIKELRAENERLMAEGEVVVTPPMAHIESLKSLASSDLVQSLQQRIADYESFISKYIVNSQEQKLLAIQAAEESALKKFEASMVPQLPPADAGGAADAVVAAIAAVGGEARRGWTVEEMLDEACDLDEKNCRGTRSKEAAVPEAHKGWIAEVLRGVDAKQSRWGPEEVSKMKEGGIGIGPGGACNSIGVGGAGVSEPLIPEALKATVEKADHGKLKGELLRRVAQGAEK